MKGRGGEREMGVRKIDWSPLVHALTDNQTHNPGLCPDQESNLQPSGAWGQCSNRLSHLARACIFSIQLSIDGQFQIF